MSKVIKVFFVITLIILTINSHALVNSLNNNSVRDQSQRPRPRPKGGEFVLRLAENLTLDYPATRGDLEFARLVEKRSNGRIKVLVYHGAKLGDEKSVIEQLQYGGIDFARVNSAPLSEVEKSLGLLSLPYLFSDAEHLWKVLDGPIGQELLDRLSKHKLIGLTFFDSGARSFYFKKPVRNLAELKGKRIRIQQSQLYIDLVKALGAIPVPMAFGDVYNALSVNEIDGAENNWASFYEVKHYQLAQYYLVDQHTRTPEVLIASQKVMNRLSEADQKLILAAARDAVVLQRQAAVAKEETSKTEVIKGKAKVFELDLVEMAKFKRAVGPIYEKYAQGDGVLINRIRETN